ncbi:hypothetical protein L3556_11660 [Candidatus Synechococcus calcipolaris G9]|uniref:Uncharacterized protein n=1 Tax=Candidatus Synechococcus calcipolaris G9 TaxID=1497997 RepID=A0ABT6F140_9SYNE|nr:hypothetical protein [Candidatus Synechococcus calcipolaris]MDG2991581.1 hypothetical protein [Candidatus Synechococcus calcipolaris G9]
MGLMRIQDLIVPILLLSIVYIGFGDRILPEPLGGLSTATREGMNDVIRGTFPGFSPLNPHDRTEEAIEKLDKTKTK